MKRPIPVHDEDVSPSLRCGICQDMLLAPRQCKLGHPFCESCILQWLIGRSTCPECRSPLSLDDLVRVTPNLMEQLDQVLVVCNNAGNGSVESSCDWTGRKGSLETHLKVCQFRAVVCALCAKDVFAKDVLQHFSSHNNDVIGLCEQAAARIVAYEAAIAVLRRPSKTAFSVRLEDDTLGTFIIHGMQFQLQLMMDGRLGFWSCMADGPRLCLHLKGKIGPTSDIDHMFFFKRGSFCRRRMASSEEDCVQDSSVGWVSGIGADSPGMGKVRIKSSKPMADKATI